MRSLVRGRFVDFRGKLGGPLSQRNKTLLICVFLIVGILLAFWGVNRCDFVSYDDPLYITENSHIQSGLTLGAIQWAFTTGYAANWHPLTWMSHMLDVQLFGPNPYWHHVTNLLFHVANTLLLFFVLYRMTKVAWPSAFVAALFALHPLHVESVAWVAERKDVLSTFFWMLTMGAYHYYVKRQTLWRYLSVLAFLTLGLMAKPMLVTLPFVLLLLDYWPLGRFDWETSPKKSEASSSRPTGLGSRKAKSGIKRIALRPDAQTTESAGSGHRRSSIATLLLEKAPFVVLAIFSSAITYVVQHRWGAVGSLEALPLRARFSNALVSYVVYMEKMIWPSNLAFFYPYQSLWASRQVLGAFSFLIVVTLIAVWLAKKFPYLIVGWLWYLGTLVPVIGLVQVGEQGMADRYTYVPLIGLFIIAAWGASELARKWPYREKILVASSILVLSCLFVATWMQVGYWKNNFTLFDHAMEVTNNNYGAYYARGNAYAAMGNQKQAIVDYDKAIELNPKYAPVYYNRAGTYAAMGNQKQAIVDYDKAIEFNPKSAEAYNNRGNAYAAMGNQKQAIVDYDKAIELNPELALAYNNRGNAYKALGNQKQAIVDYDKAIELNPKFAEAYYNRGNTYEILGNQRQAAMDHGKAIDLNPQLLNVDTTK
jgi:Flp pilus assembly protein TadD